MSNKKLIFSTHNWVLDSGASYQMTLLYHLVSHVCDLEEPLHITVPTREVVIVQKKGNVILDTNITLLDVFFIHQFSYNLISIYELDNDLNCTMTYYPNNCVIQDLTRKKMIGSCDLHDGVYMFKSIQGDHLQPILKEKLFCDMQGQVFPLTRICLSFLETLFLILMQIR